MANVTQKRIYSEIAQTVRSMDIEELFGSAIADAASNDDAIADMLEKIQSDVCDRIEKMRMRRKGHVGR